MPRKIFRPTKMQGGNIHRPCKGKENILALFAAKSKAKIEEHESLLHLVKNHH